VGWNWNENVKTINETTNPELFPDFPHRNAQSGHFPNLQKAIHMGVLWHMGQDRRYQKIPYISHPIAVMEIVREVSNDEDMLCAAVLHDVVEDTSVDNNTIKQLFGERVAMLVDWLTDQAKPEDGNRKARISINRAHTAAAPPEAKTIKLADLIHNSISIVEHDPSFASVYMKEMELLLSVLGDGDSTLYAKANKCLLEYQDTLLQKALK